MADNPTDKKKPAVERSRSEVYGMPVDTIIEHANAAYPPLDPPAEAKTEEPVWTSIEDQMANPMAKKGRGRSDVKKR